MNNSKLMITLALGLGIAASSCKKDEKKTDTPVSTAKTKYIVASTPIASTGVADYLLTADNLTEGSITTLGNGKEQDGTYRYYITHKNRFFSLLYGQGNPGAVTTYNLNGTGELTKVSDFQTETVQVFNTVNDDILLIKVPRSGNESASMYRINADQSQIVGEAQVNIVQLAGNGERAHFTWATQVGNKVYAPYMSIKGVSPDVFGTSFPDSSWVAVFSYPDLKLEKVIRDNRTGSIGAYFNNGLTQIENGDAYAFSPASATLSGKANGTKPSAIIRIKSGTTEFDQSYFFNVQEKSGGHHIYRSTYFGNGKFLLQMYGDANALTGMNKLAIVDVNAQSFTWVTGAPADVALSATSRNTITSDDKQTVYIGLNSTAEGSYVYAVDVNTVKATRGLKVEGGKITAICKLTY